MIDVWWYRLRDVTRQIAYFGDILGLELKRSPIKWWVPLILAGQLAILFGRSTEWIGVWSQTSVMPQVGAAMTAPLLAAGACWAASRVDRTGMAPQQAAAPRSPIMVELALLLSTVLWVVLPLVVTNLVADLVTRFAVGAGQLWPGYVVLGFAHVLVAVGMGHLVGRCTVSRFGPPLVGIGTLGVLMGMSNFATPLVVFSGLPYYYPYAQDVAPRVVIVAVVVACAIATGALMTTVVRWSWTRAVPVVIAAAMLPTAIFWWAPADPDGAFPFSYGQASGEECGGSPRVCVWPDHEKYLPDLIAGADRLAELDEFLDLPKEFVEYGLRGFVSGPSVTTQERGFQVRLGLWGALSDMVAIAEADAEERYCPPSDDDPIANRWYEARWAVSDWYIAYANDGPRPDEIQVSGPDSMGLIADMLNLPKQEQFDWAREQVAFLESSCG